MAALIPQQTDHRRALGELHYVYAVISRRSRGLSVGINLNPDKACNFDCIYCEVDRTTPGPVPHVDLVRLERELEHVLGLVRTGELFADERFRDTPPELRRLNDIAFSGDGEPTTCPHFDEAVRLAAAARDRFAPPETKLILITNATMLSRPNVRRGLDLLARGPHEIWAKLDAGSEGTYRAIDRSKVPFARVIENIVSASRAHPLFLQTLLVRLDGKPPAPEELETYGRRVREMLGLGARILGIQLHSMARPGPDPRASSLLDPELDAAATRIREATRLPVEVFYGRTA